MIYASLAPILLQPLLPFTVLKLFSIFENLFDFFLLQPLLPFTVLKRRNLGLIGFDFFKLQPLLPFTILKLLGVLNFFMHLHKEVATALTVYGIETVSLGLQKQ